MNNNIYTFHTVGYLTINGEETNAIEVTLTPEEVGRIHDWFKQRDMKWIGYVPLEFRKHSPELYDKLYQMEVDLCNQADIDPDFESEMSDEEIEYDCTVDPSDDECPWGALLWPRQLFDEMGIPVPNVSIWVSDNPNEELWGNGYPIFLEENYIEELRIIMEKTIWYKESKISRIDINNLADKHSELRDVIEQRVKKTLVDSFGYAESQLSGLTFSLYQFTLDKEKVCRKFRHTTQHGAIEGY